LLSCFSGLSFAVPQWLLFAFVLRASLLWWLLLPLALAMSALTIIAPAASVPVRHATLKMFMSFVISLVISWLHVGAVGALEIYFAVVVICKMLKAAPMNAR
jgi:hypothetical protein